MKHNYFKRSMLALGAVAMVASGAMAAQKWQNVNYYLGEPSGVTGWSGAFYQIGDGVAEFFGGAGNVYQTLQDMPAGEYTLTVNAFVRAANGNSGYIYINDKKAAVANHSGDVNDLASANTAFAAGQFLNTVTYTHAGGDMVVGICNPCTNHDANDWMAFDNFKLKKEGADVTSKLTNADFSDSDIDFTRSWTCENGKKPDATRGGGGVYRKTNASPYDIHQTVTLPAGTYRFGVTSFLRPGNGNEAGHFYGIKGNGSDGSNGLGVYTEGTSAYDNYLAGLDEANNVYVYVHEGEWENDEEYLVEEGIFYKKTPVKICFDIAKTLGISNSQLPDNSWEGMGTDSGDERYAATFLIQNEEACSNFVEFTLDTEKTVSFGFWKANNKPGAYWNPFCNFRLEKAVEVEDPETPVDPAEGEWHNVNYYLGEPSGVTGWSGAFYQIGDGVAEFFGGAGNVYQTLQDMPAGEYTLTVNAFVRAANGNSGYIYINDKKAAVANHSGDVNDLASANTAFAAGQFLNTVTYTHAGGDMVVGICNPCTNHDANDWMAFDNFKLKKEGADVTSKLTNADFSDSDIDFTRSWTCENGKKPDATRGGGGVYRKTNASPYDIHQTVTLPAGTYRFGVTSFLRPGNGNEAGHFYGIKGNGSDGSNGLGVYTEGTSAYDNYLAGLDEANNVYVYVHEGEWENDEEYLVEEGIFYKKTPVKICFDIAKTLGISNSQLPDNSWEGMGTDSGDERYAATFLIQNEEACSNFVEFTLDTEKTVSFGFWKANNKPGAYWNPFCNFRLEKFGPKSTSGIEGVVVEEVEDENAPVEYYNLQGVRVANPETGLYIVKHGKKVSKKFIR